MKRLTSSHNHKLLKSASLLTLLSIFERGLGFLYRIVLSRRLGAEGVGLYQVALSVFQVFLTIGTGGLPVTVSRFITKSKAVQDLQSERQSAGAGITLALLLTLPIAVIGIAFPSLGTLLFSDTRCIRLFRILLVGLSFSAVYAVIRGCFWGNKRFLAPALLELAEECTMVIFGVLLLRNVTDATSGALRVSWAITLSHDITCLCAFVCFLLRGDRLETPKKQLKPLFNATLPITFVRASGSLIHSATAILLPFMLMRTGVSKAQAFSEYGVLSGMVLPFLFIPATVIGSLALVLVPEITEAYYKKADDRLRMQITRGLQCAALVALFLIPFFYCLGDEIATLAFSNAHAGEYVRKGCVILLPMSVAMIATSLLNAMGFEKKTFQFFFAGASAQLLCILFLPKLCGGYAYVIGLFASYVLTAVCSLIFLAKKCPVSKKRRGQVFVHEYFPAFFGTFPIALFGKLLHNILQLYTSALLSVLLCTLAMALVTLVYYFALGEITFPKPLFRKRKKAAKA
jgi:stage V sporulation protein B